MLLAILILVAQFPSQPTRTITKEVILPIPVEKAWALWSDSKGVTSYGVAQSAEVELAIGGKYEWHFSKDAPAGERGSEGCTVLSFAKPRMIAFTWNTPPSIPELRKANARTEVDVFFDRIPGGTKVRLVQHGLGVGKEWDKYGDYFDTAWTSVLAKQKEWAENQPKDASEKSSSEFENYHNDGAVEVAYTRYDRARFKVAMPATSAKVWRAVATADGFKETFGRDATIELKPGGKYDIHGGKPNRVLAFTTQRMLSVTGSAPDKYPRVREGGTWGTYFIESTGPASCILTLETAGWRSGDDEFEKAFDYFIRANAMFLNMMYARLGGAPKPPAPDRMEREFDAPIAEVWKLFTSNDGLKQWMATQVEMEALKPGYKIKTKYGTEGKPGDEGGIEHTILCVEPERLFAFQCTKQPQSFPFKNAIKDLHFIIHLQPLGPERTLLTMTTVGYTNDEESRKLRQFFSEGNSQTFDQMRKALAKNKPTNR
jgi:uncharacterized protein YndB with AHSA1/START domain